MDRAIMSHGAIDVGDEPPMEMERRSRGRRGAGARRGIRRTGRRDVEEIGRGDRRCVEVSK